jgi:hypothetical protein
MYMGVCIDLQKLNIPLLTLPCLNAALCAGDHPRVSAIFVPTITADGVAPLAIDKDESKP